MQYRRLCLYLIIICAAPIVAASDVNFDSSLLEHIDNTQSVDLSYFENGPKSQAPGDYLVDVSVNHQFVGQEQMSFYLNKRAELTPCFIHKNISTLGINTALFPQLKKYHWLDCIPLTDIIPESSYHLLFNQLQLDVTLPQAALEDQINQVTPPSRWDHGITAALLNYDYSISTTHDHHSGDSHYLTSQFLNLQGGFNIGAWRLRDNAVWQKDDSYSHWNQINAFAQRDLPSIYSSLTLGQTYTQDELFDSVPLLGLEIHHNVAMEPDNLRGFAPIIQGVANTNAKVSVYQSGQLIYEKYVLPGVFTINNLTSTGSNGDLYVSVTESNGKKHAFTVPYSTLPMLQRQGAWKYYFSAGQYDALTSEQKSYLIQGAIYYGLPYGITLYSGAQLSKFYQAIAVGSGVNLGHFGAISASVTAAKSQIPDDVFHDGGDHYGQSYRFLYAKNLNRFNTNFQLVGYRYSTKNYYTFQDTMHYNGSLPTDEILTGMYHQRSKLSAVISQNLKQYGSLNLSLSSINYWDEKRDNQELRITYNNYYKFLSYTLSYGYFHHQQSDEGEQNFYVNVSIPFQLGTNSSWLNYGVSQNEDHHLYHQLQLTGTTLDDHNLGYTIEQNYDNQTHAYSGGVHFNYSNAYTEQHGGLHINGDQWQADYGLSGGIIAYKHGVIIGHQVNGATAIIEAPGANGTHIENQQGLYLDGNGHGLEANLTPYHKNNIDLDLTSLNNHVELDQPSMFVIPTEDAIIPVRFNTHIGYKAIITLIHNNRMLPLGTQVYIANKKNDVSLVDNDGMVFISGLSGKGVITAKWGDNNDQ